MQASIPYSRYILLLMAVWIGVWDSAEAQYKFNQPLQFTRDNGLPLNDNVRTVRPGEDGFIWIGSTEGLCRFDGQQYKVWRHDPADPRTLLDNDVRALLPEKNRIWVGTTKGLSVLDTKSDTFKNYYFSPNGKTDSLFRGFEPEVMSLYKDSEGEIWVGTRSFGVWKYLPERGDFYQYAYPPEAYPAIAPTLGPRQTILSIEAHDSIVWIGTTAGLQEINKKTEKVRWYTFPQENKEYQVNLNAFRRLCYHSDGLLYVGSWEAGVNVFDPVKKTLRPLPLRNNTGRELLASPIVKILSPNPDELWISTALGFVVYHTGRREVIFSKKNNLPRGEFYGAESIDRNGRIWYAFQSIRCFDPLMQQFTHYSYEHLRDNDWGYTFYVIPNAGNDLLTVCPRITDAVYLFDKAKQTWTKFPFKVYPEQLTVRGFTRQRNGIFILSADEGLFTWSPGRGLHPYPTIAGVRFRRWGDVLSGRDGRLWICAYDEGLVCLEPGKTKARIFPLVTADGMLPGGMHQFKNLMEDSRGNIWFARNNGFGVYLAQRDTILNFISSTSEKNTFPVVNTFAEDGHGRVWMNSNDGWLGYTESGYPEKGILHKMNLADSGIPGNTPHLAADGTGDVWTYTDKELVRIGAADLKLTTFSFKYGVKAAEFFHFSVLPSGELLFGTRSGIVLANPSELQRNLELPVPYLTEIQVLSKPYPFHALFGGEPLKLRHWENFFSVGFSAQAFSLGSEARFRYRLSGFDDWADAGNRRFANYTNVPGGTYFFQLQVANNEGIWNETILELPVIVATAWWATWWFRSAALLAIGGMIYGVYRYRLSQIRKKTRLKAEYEKKLAYAEMSALLAQMNPHFLFNSLNSIDSYIVKNESKKASEYLNNFARLMRLILQHSRSDYVSLSDELEALDLYLQMENLRFDNCFDYEIQVDNSLRTSSIVIPPMLIQPYLENAIWHGLRHLQKGNCEGKILLKLSREGDYLRCIIEDNGIGREKSMELKAGKNGNNHKKSMGMRITRDRIDLINKLRNVDASVEIIDLKDENGQPAGTRVELTIPL